MAPPHGVGQQEQLGRLVRYNHFVMKLFEIGDIVVELVDISLLFVGQHAV